MPSIKENRQKHILHYLHTKGSASVEDLTDTLKVSEATIRRDIAELARQKKIKRTHGKIFPPDLSEVEPPVYQRSILQAEEKRKIALKTAELIQDEETIFLGTGSTILEIAKHLTEKRELTILTNSLPIAYFLAQFPNINLVMTGGFLRRPEWSLIGYLVEHSLEQLRADKIIMSFQGVEPDHGLTNRSILETPTDRAIIEWSPHIIVVADHTKCNVIEASLIASEFDKVDTFITDRAAPDDFIEALRLKGIHVIIADDQEEHEGNEGVIRKSV